MKTVVWNQKVNITHVICKCIVITKEHTKKNHKKHQCGYHRFDHKHPNWIARCKTLWSKLRRKDLSIIDWWFRNTLYMYYFRLCDIYCANKHILLYKINTEENLFQWVFSSKWVLSKVPASISSVIFSSRWSNPMWLTALMSRSDRWYESWVVCIMWYISNSSVELPCSF